MNENKDYPTISSRDIQRNFSVLKDALLEHGTAYISYYNKPMAKVTIKPEAVDDIKKNNDAFKGMLGMFADRKKKFKAKSYETIYEEEIMKKYG